MPQEFDVLGARGALHAGVGRLPGRVVALAIVQPSADAPLSVAALDGPGLAYLLADDATHRASVRALLQYVPPRGERKAVLRCDWRASKNLARYELRSAKQVLAAGAVPLHERLSTWSHSQLRHSRAEKHVAPAVAAAAGRVCAALAERLQPQLGASARRLAADLKPTTSRDGSLEVVVMWCALPGTGAVFPADDFPASLPPTIIDKRTAPPPPAAAALLGRRGSCTLPEGDAPVGAPGRLAAPDPRRRGGAPAAPRRPGSAPAVGKAGKRASASAAPAGDAADDGADAGAAAAADSNSRLMLSRLFVCSLCGRLEPRRLALTLQLEEGEEELEEAAAAAAVAAGEEGAAAAAEKAVAEALAAAERAVELREILADGRMLTSLEMTELRRAAGRSARRRSRRRVWRWAARRRARPSGASARRPRRRRCCSRACLRARF